MLDNGLLIKFSSLLLLLRRTSSHLCPVMAPNGDLVVYKYKGFPTAKDQTIIGCPDKMRLGLQKLRDKLTVDHRNEILVAVSIASD